MAGFFNDAVNALLPSATLNRPAAAWEAAARDLGLTFTSGGRTARPMIIAGGLRGVIIEAAPQNQARTMIGTVAGPLSTRFAADFPSAAPRVELETRFPSVTSVLRHRRPFRSTVLEKRIKVVKGHEPALAQFLTPARRPAVEALVDEFWPLTLTERSMAGSVRWIIRDAGELVATLNRLVDLLSVIGSPDTIDRRTPMSPKASGQTAAVPPEALGPPSPRTPPS